MRIFDAIVLIVIVALITLSAVFSESMFRNLSLEANNGTISNTTDAATLNQYNQIYAWIYVLAALLIVTAVIIAFKLAQAGAGH